MTEYHNLYKFSTTQRDGHCQIRKISARYYHKFTQVFIQITRYSCQSLTKHEFSRRIFEKYSNIKFHENPSNGRRAVPCGQIYTHDSDNRPFTQLCVQAQKLYQETECVRG